MCYSINMFNIDPNLYNQYSKEQIDEAVRILTYKKVDELPKTQKTEGPIMYVFRHGQSTDNADFLFSGWRNIDITQDGIEQALVLADKLKDIHFDMLFVSDLIRSKKTMQYAMSKNEYAKNLRLLEDSRIKEKSYGELQGKSKLESYLQDPEETQRLRRTIDAKAPGGESVLEVCERVKEFCDQIIPVMKRYKLIVAVSCHGNSMRGFRKYFEGDKFTNQELALLETPLGQDFASYYVGD